MSPNSTDAAHLQALSDLVNNVTLLLRELEASLLAISQDKAVDEPTPPPEPLDSLGLARDAAALIKAHSTKLSLLIINEPFTPSAIVTVLRQVSESPAPALATAVQTCDEQRYTRLYRRELAWECHAVLKELRRLVEKIPMDGKALPKNQQSIDASSGSLEITGVLWAACDTVVNTSNRGVSWFLGKRVGEYKDTLKDIMEELKEWGEETDEDTDEDDFANETGIESTPDPENEHSTAQNLLDSFVDIQSTIPKGDPDGIRERLESCIRRLRLTGLLCQAVSKRRLKILPRFPVPATSTIPKRLDESITILGRLPDRFGDVAAAFYDLQPQEIESTMEQCFLDASAVSELLGESWEGGRDEFSEWAEKFQEQIKKK